MNLSSVINVCNKSHILNKSPMNLLLRFIASALPNVVVGQIL